MTDTVKILLDGEDIELIPTRGALESLSNKYGNMNNVTEQLVSNNFSVMSDLIYYGVDQNKRPDLNKTKDAVYKEGVINLLEPLSDYLMLLMNGGKKPSLEVGKTTNPEV